MRSFGHDARDVVGDRELISFADPSFLADVVRMVRQSPKAMAVRMVATANVSRMPNVTASGDATVMSDTLAPRAKTAPIADAPVMSPMFRERLSIPEINPLWSEDVLVSTAELLDVWKSA